MKTKNEIKKVSENIVNIENKLSQEFTNFIGKKTIISVLFDEKHNTIKFMFSISHNSKQIKKDLFSCELEHIINILLMKEYSIFTNKVTTNFTLSQKSIFISFEYDL